MAMKQYCVNELSHRRFCSNG